MDATRSGASRNDLGKLGAVFNRKTHAELDATLLFPWIVIFWFHPLDVVHADVIKILFKAVDFEFVCHHFFLFIPYHKIYSTLVWVCCQDFSWCRIFTTVQPRVLTELPTATPHKTRATKPTITTAKNVIISNSYQFLSHHKIYYTLIAAKVKAFLCVVFLIHIQKVFSEGSSSAISWRSRWWAGLRPRTISTTSYFQSHSASSRNATHIAQSLFSHFARLTCFCHRTLTARRNARPIATVIPM